MTNIGLENGRLRPWLTQNSRGSKSLTRYAIAVAVLLALTFLTLHKPSQARLHRLQTYASTNLPSLLPSYAPPAPPILDAATARQTTLNTTYNRIAKVSMFFGQPSRTYERALEAHERHAQVWGYPMYVLKRDDGCGMWTKVVYVMSVLAQELAKDKDARAEWLMWFDADTVLLNPLIPLSIFLPPPDLAHIHFVGARDWNGLNAGVFFLRVHPWSLSMITSAMSYPICHGDEPLQFAEQTAMRLTFGRLTGNTDHLGWKSGVVYMPRTLFNAYETMPGDREKFDKLVEKQYGLEQGHAFDGVPGSMLVHFPGMPQPWRGDLMADWEKMVEGEWGEVASQLNISQNRTLDTAPRFGGMPAGEEGQGTKEKRRMGDTWARPLEDTEYGNLTTTFWNRYRRAMTVIRQASRQSASNPSIHLSDAASRLLVALSEDADEAHIIDEKIDEIRELLGNVKQKGALAESSGSKTAGFEDVSAMLSDAQAKDHDNDVLRWSDGQGGSDNGSA